MTKEHERYDEDTLALRSISCTPGWIWDIKCARAESNRHSTSATRSNTATSGGNAKWRSAVPHSSSWPHHSCSQLLSSQECHQDRLPGHKSPPTSQRYSEG